MNLNKKLERYHKGAATLYKRKNSELNYYGHDCEGAFSYGLTGRDVMTKDVYQDIDWDSRPVKYKFNSLGLRGPEPDYNAKTKILFAGGSMIFGTGVNVEDTFPYKLSNKLGASYINLSETDSFTDLIDELDKHIAEFKPNYIILNDTRFLDEFGYAWLLFWLKVRDDRSNKEERDIIQKHLKPSLQKRNKKVLELILYKLNNMHNIPVILVSSFRKDFGFKSSLDTQGTKILHIDKNYVIDLGRDNRHPGPRTHDKITLELLSLLSH